MCTQNLPIKVHFPYPGARTSTIYQRLLTPRTFSREETCSIFSISFLVSNFPKLFSNIQKGIENILTYKKV
jgi:hypothetical protein